MSTINRKIFIDFINEASDIMIKNKEYLMELDAAFGDGDLGLTMSTGFKAAKDTVNDSEESDIGKLCMQVGMSLSKAAPSTMGTLIASGFIRAAKSLKGTTELDIQGFVTFTFEFANGVMELGKAKLGDRTLVDSIYPAYLAAKTESEKSSDLKTVAKASLSAAEKGVEETKNMKSAFGRGVFFRDQVLGHPDQGAIVGKLIYQCFVNIL